MLNSQSGPSAEFLIQHSEATKKDLLQNKASFLEYRAQDAHNKERGGHPYDRGLGSYHEY